MRSVCLFVILGSAMLAAQSDLIPLISQPLVAKNSVWSYLSRPDSATRHNTVTTQEPAHSEATSHIRRTAEHSPDAVQYLQFTARTYTVDSNPRFVTTADLNGDGILDLLVANDSSSDISVLLGNADGTFQSAMNYPAGRRPFSIAVGDFNADGMPDLAVAGGAGITIFINNGNGTFLQTNNYPTPPFSTSITSADLNGDGKLDLAWAGYNDDSANVMLGNGDGTFQPSVRYQTGTAPEYIVAGDFNNDGKLDVATANEIQSRIENFPGTMSVLLGNGDGTFQTFSNFNAGNYPYGLAVGDFNSDGNLDAVVANTANNYVSVFLGEGNGNFSAANNYPADQNCISVTVADINLDGKLDLVVANINGNDVSVLLGNGDGSFQSPSNFATGTAPYSVAAGDFNGDGYPDLVVATYEGDTITVLLNVPSPYVALSPSKLNFGSQNVGTTSAPQNVTLTNSGDAALNIGSIVATGDFSQTNTCPVGGGLAAGSNCIISVTFTPSAEGRRHGAVTITDNAPGSPQSVPLTGVGTPPAVTFSPASLTFLDQVVFTTSPAQQVTLTNSGAGVLKIKSISVTGPFRQTNNCPSSLNPNTYCTITVKFHPTTKGVLHGAVSVKDNAPGSPQKVPLTGTGTYVQLIPAKLNFGTQPVGTRSLAKKVTLTNKGSVTLNISGIAITGAAAGDFAETNTCGKSVASGASCFIKVTFKPLVQGKRTADVSVSDDGGGSPQQVTLTGTGT